MGKCPRSRISRYLDSYGFCKKGDPKVKVGRLFEVFIFYIFLAKL